jgi:hypothetical protein
VKSKSGRDSRTAEKWIKGQIDVGYLDGSVLLDVLKAFGDAWLLIAGVLAEYIIIETVKTKVSEL